VINGEFTLEKNKLSVPLSGTSSITISKGSGSYSIVIADGKEKGIATAEIDKDGKRILFRGLKEGTTAFTVKDEQLKRTQTIEVMVTEEKKNLILSTTAVSLKENDLMIDINKLKKSDVLLQCFAMFTYLKEVNSPYKYVNELIDLYEQEIEKNSFDIAFAKSYSDIQKNKDSNKISAFLTIEEGEAIEGSIENLIHFYNRGVRMITLTWNFENCIGFGNKRIIENGECVGYTPDKVNGLKPFGFEVVEKMEELGIIVDVSHLSDAGIYDIIDIAKKPFVASHSNARTICNHPRNLTDDMIKKMANKGCISGLNFYPEFLSKNFSNRERKAYIDDTIDMLKYMVNVGGSEFVALGSDYDGFSDILEWKDAGGTGCLTDAMEREGFSTSLIENITYKNALRIIKEVVK